MNNFAEILNSEPKFRREQIYRAWFDKKINSYSEITTLSLALREKLKNISWLTVKEKKIAISKIDNTRKVLLELADGAVIETVLMARENKKENRQEGWRYTVCVSTQVGCPMKCVFCCTGKMGWKRNLSSAEIVDQFRFWQKYLQTQGGGEVENVVLMGQGEPLLNYEAVKEALQILLKYGEVGPRKITLSTVGVPVAMEKMVTEKDFPPVRLALSLHSALEEKRQEIIPSHQKGFLKFLVDWAKKYHGTYPSRTHFIGLEYTMLAGVNDSPEQLKALIKLARQLGRVRINLIAYNSGEDQEFKSSESEIVKNWHKNIMDVGIVCTVRQSQGQDIAAACGQLANQSEKNN